LWTDTFNRRFKFDKRSQLFIRTHNETLSVVAMCVGNKDCLPVRINRSDTTPTPAGCAEIVSYDSSASGKDFISFRCGGALEHRLQFCQLKLDAVLHDG
jgi:hypothetical protein